MGSWVCGVIRVVLGLSEFRALGLNASQVSRFQACWVWFRLCCQENHSGNPKSRRHGTHSGYGTVEHSNLQQLARTANNYDSIRGHSAKKKNDVHVLLILIMVVTLRV